MRSPDTGKLSIALAVSPPQSCSTVAMPSPGFAFSAIQASPGYTRNAASSRATPTGSS
jgi:hypothetical protein